MQVYTGIPYFYIYFRWLAQSFYISIYNVDVHSLWLFGKPRHAQNFSGDGNNHFRTVIDYNILDMKFKVVHRTVYFRIGRERILCFGNAKQCRRIASTSSSVSLAKRLKATSTV